MGFCSDFIEDHLTKTAAHQELKARYGEMGLAELLWEQGISLDETERDEEFADYVAAFMSEAKIIKMRGEQAEVLVNSAVQDGQDFIKWLRLTLSWRVFRICTNIRF